MTDCVIFAADDIYSSKGARGVVMLKTNIVADLRQQIHDDLRTQHPEWILPSGESPMCDAYEARLMDLLALVPDSFWATKWQRAGD